MALSAAVYAGKLPSESGMPEFQLDSLQLPRDLPVTLPSSLVRQRPDIQAGEALLHEASAQVGVATANMLPAFTISANGGYINTAAFTQAPQFTFGNVSRTIGLRGPGMANTDFSMFKSYYIHEKFLAQFRCGMI